MAIGTCRPDLGSMASEMLPPVVRARERLFLLNGTSISPGRDQVVSMRELIESGMDWSELLRLAIPHGVLPLLTRNLVKHLADAVPSATLFQLERFGKKAGEQARLRSLELSRLVDALSQDGFRVLPFKGPVLASAFYGDIGLRESHDLDLWIDPAQYAQAVEWFRDAGYRPVHHVQGIPQELAAFRKRQEEFWSPDGTVVIDVKANLEWSRASLFNPPFEQVWTRRSQVIMDGSKIGVLAIEDLLPSLAVHGSKHLWRRLNWIVDVAAVIVSRPELDWAKVLSHATAWRCRRKVLVAAALTSYLYRTEIPAVIREEIQKPAICLAAQHICSALFKEKSHTLGGLGAELLYCLRTGDSISERLRFSRHCVRRILHADDIRMMTPMSNNIRRIYSACSSVRKSFQAH